MKAVYMADLAAIFKMLKSMVFSILKNMKTMKPTNIAEGVISLTCRHFIKEMEKVLLLWINEKQLAGVISERIV